MFVWPDRVSLPVFQYEGVLRLHYRALWLQQDCLKGL